MAEPSALYDSARARWPGVVVDHDAFAAAAGAGVAGEEGAAELYLALACAAGDAVALRCFERAYIDEIRGALRPVAADDDAVAEVKQRLRMRLLVAEPGQSPRILRYAGRGRLGGLVQVAAARLALNYVRDAGTGRREPEDLVDAVDDLEAQQLKREDVQIFKACFEAAVAELSARQRTMLRLHLLDRLSIDEIGRVYDVHRSTAARQLATARRRVTEGTQQALQARVARDPARLRPLVTLLHSRLELSLSRVLQPSRVDHAEGHDASASTH